MSGWFARSISIRNRYQVCACGESEPEYARGVLERAARAHRDSAAGRFRGVCASLGLVLLPFFGCSTYDDNLLSAASSEPDAGVSANAAAAGVAGSTNAAGATQSAGARSALPSPVGPIEEAGAAGLSATAGSAEAGAGAGVSAAGAGGTLGSGGTFGSSGAGVAGAAAGGASAPTYELIDDFEDRDAFILPVHKRNGPWYVFDDNTSGSESPFTIALLSGPNARGGSLAALHFTASGFSDWGAGVGADLVNLAGKKVAYDVSAYSGLHFYAKISSGAQSTLKLLVPTTYSDPDGGKCNDSVTDKRCNDHFFYPITPLKTGWDEYRCDFADMIQQGFGLIQPELDPTSVYSVQFTLSTKLVPVDIWIDDLSFIEK